MEVLHSKWMKIALEEAALSAQCGEVPVGAVIVKDEKLISSAHNVCETKKSALAHAELLAIEKASDLLGGWRLQDCTLYVTLEPCPMCTGAIINSRISRVVFAAKDPRAGACGSLIDLTRYPLESTPEIISGILQEESLSLLRSFFSTIRNKNK